MLSTSLACVAAKEGTIPVSQRISGELYHVFLKFDQAWSGRPVGSKTVSGWARSGLFRVDFSGFRVLPDHVARSKIFQTHNNHNFKEKKNLHVSSW